MYEIQKYFTGKAFGGYSDCMTDVKNPWWSGATLSNCVGLAWGMFNLDRGRGQNFRRVRGDAKDIYPTAKQKGSGFMCGMTPKTSSIACYDNGGAGHVVYLLKVWKDGQAVGIESNYSGTLANKLCLRVKLGNPKKWYKNYMGCVYDYC